MTRNAFIFGGSRGIGAAIAKRLAQDGCNVAFTYLSRPDAAQDVVSTIQEMGRQAQHHPQIC